MRSAALSSWIVCLWLVPFSWHRGQGRYIRPGQKLHSSVIHGLKESTNQSHSSSKLHQLLICGIEKSNSGYRPKAYLKKTGKDWLQEEGHTIGSWSDLIIGTQLPGFVERDLFDRAGDLIRCFSDKSTERSRELVGQFMAMCSSSAFFMMIILFNANITGLDDGVRALRELPNVQSELECSHCIPRDVQFYCLRVNKTGKTCYSLFLLCFIHC